MADPILRVRGSGYSGSGYKIPTDGGRVVPSVTTVAGIAHKPGLIQWAVDNVAAFAVSNVDAILNRTTEQGYGFLRWRWKNEPKLDEEPNIRNWHNYVLNDAADLGTWFHEYADSDLTDGFTREPVEPWQEQMVDAWNLFKFEHDVEALLTEQTVYNPRGYAGTFDALLRIDGKVYMADFKTGRNTWPEHYMQLAALGASPVWMHQVDSSHPGAVAYKRKDKPTTYWVEDVLPDFAGYAIVHVRPDDDDGTPAFCDLKVIENELIDMHYDWFLGYLTAKEAERKVKQYTNSKEEK